MLVVAAGAAAAQASGIPADTWLGFGVAAPIVVVLMGLLVYERKRADAERQRAAAAHDRIIDLVEKVTAALGEQAATNRTTAAALDALARLVERER